MNKKVALFTTPIYYPSGNLHIGHLYTTTVAWALRNYKRLHGYDAMMMTGADEHGQKIYETAIKNNKLPQAYVDEQANKFKDLWKLAQIDYDFFSRTSAVNHWRSVKKTFSALYNLGYIYKGFYEGLYSVSDEEFVTETNAVAKDGKFYHPVSGHELITLKEDSYFFKLTAFSEFLSKEFLNLDNVSSQAIINELTNNFLGDNAEDLSVTRIKISWGIPIVEDDKHIIYVWLDALFNYVSRLGYKLEDDSLFKKYWQNADEVVNIVGKEITRFHCLYWPSFLKALDVRLPFVLTHGWIITPSGKMSKSKGNVVDPVELLNKYGAELIKFYFGGKMTLSKDNTFSEELLVAAINNELVNTFGNLISRTEKMIENNFDRALKYHQDTAKQYHNVYAKIDSLSSEIEKVMTNYELTEAFELVHQLGKELNTYIDETEPWKLTKDDAQLEQILVVLLNGIYAMSTFYQILLPNKINELATRWNIDQFAIEDIAKHTKFNKLVIKKGANLFERIK